MSVNTSEEYLDELLQAIEPIIRLGEPEILNPMAEEPEPEPVEDSSAITDLLASLAGEEGEISDEGMSQEDVESMLNAVSSQPMAEGTMPSYDEDVKELLKQFTEDEDLSDIQDILDKNDNGEALDNSMLDLPDVEVFQLEEESDEEEEASDAAKKANPIGKLFGGISGLFRKRKDKKGKEEESDAENIPMAEGEPDENSFAVLEDGDAISLMETDEEPLDIDGVGLEELLGADIEELAFDEDMSDIEQLLSQGALTEENAEVQEDGKESTKSGKKNSKQKGGKEKKKAKKESFFSKVLNALTEEVEDTAGGTVPEAGKTGVTQENLNILEELSAEDKKKVKKAKKEEKQNKKAGKKGKNAPQKGEDDEADNSKESDKKKARKAKRAGKKREKQEKPRKVEEITKPEKKLPKKRVLSVFVLCFSILAAVLILQNVVSQSDNWKEAQYAFDNGDYATCFANLESIERNDEEEELYQKTYIIMSVQRKWDAYKNFMTMGENVEALNSLLEGVALYRSREELALENGVHAQTTVIYQDMTEALQGYGLSQEDIDTILGYESKVTYTKRLDSIINGTPFVAEEEAGSTYISEPQPLQDVLPGEEDFLPDDTTLVYEISAVTELPEEKPAEVQEMQSSGETVVVGSNPVDVSTQNDAVSFEEPVVTGGQNVGTGSTNISSEVTGQNVVVGVQ